ncbi:MAG: helicase, partial [Microbacterium sp.]|nr:helicase [Microbacterium sp.]
GLGKTAQSVLAASVAGAYPLLAVVPNVVKMNWAREVERWTPQRRATVISGDGDQIDAFADVFIVNYEVLDRHLSWLGSIGLRGMVVDEAHFIKNLGSQRSQNVLALAGRIREQVRDPLMLALTGTPLINDVEDFDAIWRFLGWTNGEKPGPVLMERLDETGLTPADKAFYPAARDAVISMGIVRRKKKDVAADLPDKLVADLPVQLDDEYGRSIRQAEHELGERLAARYRRIIEARGDRVLIGEADSDIVRLVATQELEESKAAGTGAENVFTMVRRIGQAKAVLAADYAAQLQRSVGKVVFFAKHIDVMDAAEAHFAAAGLRTVSLRGDQTATARQDAIDAFNNDPDVAIAVCSLTAAGVGVNMQGPPSRRRRSTACTASVRKSPSPRGGSSPPTPSTPRSPSSSTRSRGSRPALSTVRPSIPPRATRCSCRPSCTCSARRWARTELHPSPYRCDDRRDGWMRR